MRSKEIDDLFKMLAGNGSDTMPSLSDADVDFANEVGPKLTVQSTLTVSSEIPDEEVAKIKGSIDEIVMDLRINQKISDIAYRTARNKYLGEITKMCNTSYSKYWRNNFK